MQLSCHLRQNIPVSDVVGLPVWLEAEAGSVLNHVSKRMLKAAQMAS